MAGSNSSWSFPPVLQMHIWLGSVDNLISIPVNSYVLWLIVSGTKSLFETEFLTLNLVSMEIAFSLCFFLSLLAIFLQDTGLILLKNLYHGSAVVGRALFQCHICVDRYLAVVHPMFFIRYKNIRYRGACLAAVWLCVVSAGLSNSFKPMNGDVIALGAGLLLVPALSIEVFCSLSILRILRKPSPGDSEAKKKKEGNKQKMRAIYIICLSLVLLVFNVFPYFAISFASSRDSVSDMIVIAFTISNVGSSFQGLLFLSRSGKLPCKG